MARGSRDDRRSRRALDELAAGAKQHARGQRVDAIALVDAYLVLDADERAGQSALLTALWKIVGAALDELAKRPPANAILTAWITRLDKAPELICAPTEPAEVGPNRWWALTRAALAGRLYANATQGWRHVADEAHEKAPRLASLVEAWLTPPHVIPDEQLAATAEIISRLEGQLPASISARANDPRLGFDTNKPAAKLSANASDADIVGWVERVAAGTSGLAAQIRGSARAMAPDRAAVLWAEAAPFILREALRKDAPELAGQLADAFEAQRAARRPPTKALRDDLELAQGWLSAKLSQVLHPGPEASKSIAAYARIALEAIALDARHRDVVMRALTSVPTEAMIHTEPIEKLVLSLLERRRTTPASSKVVLEEDKTLVDFWLWALATWEPDACTNEDAFIAAAEGVVEVVMSSPEAVAKALNQMSREVRARVYQCFAMSLDATVVIRLSTWLVPLLQPSRRGELLTALLEFTDALDDEERGGGALPPGVRDELDRLIEDGLSPKQAVDRLLAELPPPMRLAIRDALLAYATAPDDTHPLTAALWSALGPEAIKHAGRLWHLALEHATTPGSRRRLIEVDTKDAATPGEWAERAHRIFGVVGVNGIHDLMEAFASHFGRSVGAYREAFRQQVKCPCGFLLALAKEIMRLEHEAGLPQSAEMKSAWRLFPDQCKWFELTLKGFPAVGRKKGTSKKSAPREPAKKADSKKSSGGANAEGGAKAKAKAPEKDATKKPAKDPAKATKKDATTKPGKDPAEATAEDTTKKPPKDTPQSPVVESAPEPKKRRRTPKGGQIPLPMPLERGRK
jgi:hypothetical protein